MVTFVVTGTGIVTSWGLRAAWDRRFHDLGSAMASEFLKACFETAGAITDVAKLLTEVNAAVQLASANLVADVVEIRATLLVAFVFATMFPLGALAVAAWELVPLARVDDVDTGGVHVAVAAGTFGQGGLVAGGAISFVADPLAGVRIIFPSTAKKSRAHLFTRGNGVDALVPVIALQVRQGSLPTRAVRHDLWSQRARAAFTLMTEHFAIMVTAGELLLARYVAGEPTVHTPD